MTWLVASSTTPKQPPQQNQRVCIFLDEFYTIIDLHSLTAEEESYIKQLELFAIPSYVSI